MNKQVKLEARVKTIISRDKLDFKDLNGNGQLDPYEDWRLPAVKRAEDLVSRMNLDEKLGLMFINSRPMGRYQSDPALTSHDGILDEEIKEANATIFTTTKTFGTTETIERLHLRHFILRHNPPAEDIATWINKLNELAEGTRLGIPVIVASNSRNENAEVTFGMNDASGVFSTWPGTMGLAAAAKGDIKQGKTAELISQFAAIARSEWNAVGLKKGYMYMADVVTDPRWQRAYGTFGEDTTFITDAIERLVNGFQGEQLDEDSVALTIKHFPGGGARENGFDPHYEEGKWNIYATPGSLEEYHLPPFLAAIKAGSSSIMPYYSMPNIEKSAEQQIDGETVDFKPYGFAFNDVFIQDLLRDKLGFKGYVNSDSGIIDNMAWGVKDKPTHERAAIAVNTGVDIIADSNNVEALKEAYEKGLVSEDRINEACVRLLREMFELGLFENPYRDPISAQETVAKSSNWDAAYRAHQKSVVVLKNRFRRPPLAADILEGKKVYIETFCNDRKKVAAQTERFVNAIKKLENIELTDRVEEADIAFLYLAPQSGNYFTATPGLLELEIVEDKENKAIDGSLYTETTLADAARIQEIAGVVHNNGGQVIISLNFVLPWLVGRVEPFADVFIASFETIPDAQMDVLSGKCQASGVLPITLPASPDVIAVDDNGDCISPNDVPGYAKDRYMPEGMSYAYVDADGNRYVMDYGLHI